MSVNSNALKRYINTIPKVFNPATNRVIYALLYAMALSDDDVEASIEIAKGDLFVRTATGKELDRLANSLGVQRPATLGLTDIEFQNLIPNLSLKPKVIRKAFYDTADVFWGPLFSRANVTSTNFAPFNLSIGDVFSLQIDNKDIQTKKILPGQIAINGQATADEVVAILSNFKQITPSIITDQVTGNQAINIRTNTPGPAGVVNILSSTGFTSLKLDMKNGKTTILALDQRVSIYNLNKNELIIEIPSIVPALRRTLKGSHHFHADATLAGPVPPANGVWQGSFLFNPTGSVDTKTISAQRAHLLAPITKNSVYTSALVAFDHAFDNPSGFILFDYGTDQEEGPIFYRGIPNSSTILLDPSYVFKFDHQINSMVNVVTAFTPYVPQKTGKDYAIYLTSPSGARQEVQAILDGLKAAGIILHFIVLAPKYKYIIDNPYLPEIEPTVDDVDTD